MGRHSVTLDLPDELYVSLANAAEASDRPLETVLVESLQIMFRPPYSDDGLQQELAALASYSDAQLWAVVYRRLSWQQSLRLRELTASNKAGTITSAERDELERLVELTDRHMLLRSEALLLLKQRGHNLEPYGMNTLRGMQMGSS